MNVNSNNKSGSDEQMMDILLVFDKEKKTINAVKGIDENGELQTVPPKQELYQYRYLNRYRSFLKLSPSNRP